MEQSSESHLTSYIMRSDLFKDFTPALENIEAELRWVRLAAGETLFCQGDAGDSLYVLVRGRLRVTIEHPDGTRQVIDELEPEVSVGEMALLTGQARTATVSAVEDSELVELSRGVFDQLAARNPAAMLQFTQSIVPRLRRTQLVGVLIALFGNLSTAALREIEADLEWQHLRNGEALFRQGEPGDALYIVINGRLRIVMENADGSQRPAGEVSRGESVGEFAVVTGENRTATVYAIRDTDVVKLSKTSFDRLVEQYPRAMLQITRMIVNRVRQTSGSISGRGITVKTIALIPAGPEVPLAEFADHLTQALTTFGPTLHLNSERCDRLAGKTGVAQTPEDQPTSVTLVQWLSEQETRYNYIVYEADPDWSSWTRRCIGQADRVLIVGQAGSDPNPGELEAAMRQLRVLAREELVLLHPVGTERPRGTRQWLDRRQVFTHHHVRLHVDADLRRLVHRLTGRALGLVLGGGGARGLGHIGAIRALEEAGLSIDLVGGTSMGALIAAGYASGMDIPTITEAARRFGVPKQVFDYTAPLVSFFASQKITQMLHAMFGDLQIEDLWLPYFCVTTNLTRAKPVVHQVGALWKYVRASTCLPTVFSPVLDDGDLLVDGGVINLVPIDVMRELSEGGPVIAVDTSLEIDLRDEYAFGPSVSGWRVLWSKLNPFAQPLNVPSIFATLLRVIEVNDVYHGYAKRHLADLYIAPPLAAFSTLDFKSIEQIIEIGYQAARDAILQWKDKRRVNS